MTKKQVKIYNWFEQHKGYIKKGQNTIFNLYKNKIDNNVGVNDFISALKQARIDFKDSYTNKSTKVLVDKKLVLKRLNNKEIENSAWKVVERISNFDKTPWGKKLKQFEAKVVINKYNPDNVLFLPDLHAPFIKKGVLEFCKEQQEKYDCGTVIFAGDIVDGHAWSYHEHDPDGMSVGDELEAAKKQLIPWFEAFPNAISLMGNHDLLIQRKARTIGLSKHFIKGFGDVLGAPKGWEFKLEHVKDNVLYKHGNIGDAFIVAKKSRMSTCQGHFHAKTFVQWSVSEKDAIFGLQVGWGADRDAYAFDYGKSFSDKPIISLGLILDKGTTPIVKLMNL